MALGPDLFPTVVKWVVIFELLVKKIGCDDMETWGAHLSVINFFFSSCICKKVAKPCNNDAIECHASAETCIL